MSWRTLPAIRIIFDIIGNYFELQYLAALYYASPQTAAYVLAYWCAVYLPSHVACYRYAFRR